MASLLDNLLALQTPGYFEAWKTFLFNIPLVQKITTEVGPNPTKLQEVLNAGQSWTGEGCTTGYCSRTLFKSSQVTLVSSEFDQYKNCFLFSLCLHWSLEVLILDLVDKAGEAAYI